MSRPKKKSGLVFKGSKREHELEAAIIDWAAAGLSRAQTRSIAESFNQAINLPPLSDKQVAAAFKAAWKQIRKNRKSGADSDPLELEDELFGALIDVITTKPKFLWYPWIVSGAINFVEGMPEKGKSFLTMKIATEISRGGELPSEPELKPCNILVLDPEDDPSYTVKPRMESMGANISRIRYGKRDFDLTKKENLAALKAQVERHKIGLIIIDPLNNFMPGVDIHRDNQVRGVLGTLNDMCQTTGCTVIAVRHHTKAKTGEPLTRGLGSIGFSAFARSVVMVGRDPSDPDLGAVAHVKMNLAKKAKTLTFALSGGDGREGTMPKFVWCGETDATALEVAEGPTREVGRPAEQSQNAEEFLRQQLEAGPKSIKALNSLAERRSIASSRTLRRVASDIGLISVRVDGENGWKLPDKM